MGKVGRQNWKSSWKREGGEGNQVSGNFIHHCKKFRPLSIQTDGRFACRDVCFCNLSLGELIRYECCKPFIWRWRRTMWQKWISWVLWSLNQKNCKQKGAVCIEKWSKAYGSMIICKDHWMIARKKSSSQIKRVVVESARLQPIPRPHIAATMWPKYTS